jgi:hypothetical protein
VAEEGWLIGGVETALAQNEAWVERWLRDEPGAWGRLAGAAVLACRARAGRPLTEAERRRVWAHAWRSLQSRRPRGN